MCHSLKISWIEVSGSGHILVLVTDHEAMLTKIRQAATKPRHGYFLLAVESRGIVDNMTSQCLWEGIGKDV
jgi:hypothetical protein